MFHFGYFFTGQNAVQIHANDTKRMISHTFDGDYDTDLKLYLYLYGRRPAFVNLFLQREDIKKEIASISVKLYEYVTEKKVKVQPPMEDIFNAFKGITKWNIRVVIVGQDPTPIPGEATGIAFSLKQNSNPTSVSTGNILKLLVKHGYKVNMESGDLTRWAEQGVLLLNSALTITVGWWPDSDWHLELWKTFTSKLIKHISENTEERLVWMLWGQKAKNFRHFIQERHLVLEGVHPSPNNGDKFAEQNDFFKEANTFLEKNGREKINWNLA